MGQSVQIVHTRILRPGIVRFEIDRSLTGMAHESYRDVAETIGDRPPDVLAARLFESGFVTAVHVFSNVITVSVADDTSHDDWVSHLQDRVRNLFVHYQPGVMPTPV